MEITLVRGRELMTEPRQLPAETYNTGRILLGQAGTGHVFVPIRSMQYLAIVDHEEIVFIDSAYKNVVAIAWTDFHPEQRSDLQEAVPYTARYYTADGARTMLRLQGEYLLALRTLSSRQPHLHSARILKFSDKRD